QGEAQRFLGAFAAVGLAEQGDRWAQGGVERVDGGGEDAAAGAGLAQHVVQRSTPPGAAGDGDGAAFPLVHAQQRTGQGGGGGQQRVLVGRRRRRRRWC